MVGRKPAANWQIKSLQKTFRNCNTITTKQPQIGCLKLCNQHLKHVQSDSEELISEKETQDHQLSQLLQHKSKSDSRIITGNHRSTASTTRTGTNPQNPPRNQAQQRFVATSDFQLERTQLVRTWPRWIAKQQKSCQKQRENANTITAKQPTNCLK